MHIIFLSAERTKKIEEVEKILDMEKISKKLTNWLIAKKAITKDEEEVYEYGVFQMLTNTLDTISILILAVIFQKILVVCCYIVCFSLLRKYAGGYHAKSVKGCYIMTVGLTALMLLVVSFCNISMVIILAFWLISGIFVFLFAPVQNRNKSLDEVECLVYRRRSIIIWILESVFLWGLYYLKFSEGTKSIVFGNILIVISMIVELGSTTIVKERRKT